MKRLTLSVDGLTLERAREAAHQRGTSLDELVREFLAELAGTRQRQRAVEALRTLWAEGGGDSGGRTIAREEAYEERSGASARPSPRLKP